MSFRRIAVTILSLLGSHLVISTAKAALVISSKTTENVVCSEGLCHATSINAVLNVNDLVAMLENGDVTVQSGSSARVIEIDTKLSWTNASRLTLDAGNFAIKFNKPVKVAGPGSLTMITLDKGNGGDIFFNKTGHVSLSDPANSTLMINGHQYALAKNISDIRDLVHQVTTYVALANSFKSKGIFRKTPLPSSPGIFEGLGNTISNLSITQGSGLFYGSGGIIRDLLLSNVEIHAGTLGCVGSLVNFNTGQIVAVSVSGKISGFGSVGGLVCTNQFGTISRSQTHVTVNGGSQYVGGIVAVNQTTCVLPNCSGSISESYSSGAVTGGDNTMVGGLIGYNLGGQVSNSYSTASVSGGANASLGGLIGLNADDPGEQSPSVIATSYSNGAIAGGSGAILGGLIGQDAAATGGISDSYWDLDTSGIGNSAQGAGNLLNDPGITGLSDARLKSGLPAGFLGNTWKEKANLNDGYPYLIDNPPPQ